jgi:hypothetical protein
MGNALAPITQTSPTATLAAFNDVCENASSFILTGGLPSGGTYSGTGVSNGNFYPSDAGVGTHSITYTYVDASGNLSSASNTITVLAKPDVSITPDAATICPGSSIELSAPNMIAYYKFDEGTGLTTTDASGNNLNGTLINAPIWVSSSAPISGGAGNTLTFSNTTHTYIEIPDNSLFNQLQTAFTLEAWIYQTDNTNNTIVDRANYNFLFETCPNGQSGLGFYNPTGAGWTYSSGNIPANQWVHVAVSWDGLTKTLNFYLNGNLLSTHTRTKPLIFNAGPMNIGRQSPLTCQCNEMDGQIDELKIWSSVRTQAEIQATMGEPVYLNTYSWSPATALNTSTGYYVTASPTATTQYTATTTDANGCQNSANALVIVNPPLSTTVNVTDASASGLNDGSATINFQGGTAPYYLPLEEFSHTFDGTTIDNNLFSHDNLALYTQNDQLEVYANGSGNDRFFFTKQTFVRTVGKEFSCSFYYASGGEFYIGLFGNSTNSTIKYQDLLYAFKIGGRGTPNIREDGQVRRFIKSYFMLSNNWYDIKIVLKTSGADYYLKNASDSEYTLVYSSAYSTETDLRLGFAVYRGNYPMITDNWVVTKIEEVNTGSLTIPDLAIGDYSYSYSDAIGCQGNFDFKIEEYSPPVISCMASYQFCVDASASYTIPQITASSKYGIASISYEISGSTVRSGSGKDASGLFNSGISTIKWTVTDMMNKTGTCSTELTINLLPISSITSSGDDWCNGVTLTASATPNDNGNIFEWTFPDKSTETTESIVLNSNESDAGMYNLYVTDEHACISLPINPYVYAPEKHTSSYSLIGFKSIKLGENNTVANGSIGVTDGKGKAHLGKNTEMSGIGSFIKSEKIDLHPTATVVKTIYSKAAITLPAMQYYNVNGNNIYKVIKVKKKSSPQTIASSAGYVSVKVEAGAVVILEGSTFGFIEIGKDAKVTFTSSSIDIQNISISSLANGKKSTIAASYLVFENDASVRIKDRMDVEGYVSVNPLGKKVMFYIGVPNASKKPELEIKSNDVNFVGNVYIPDGKIQVHGASKARVTTYMTGFFIAESIESNGKNVEWNWFDCYFTSSLKMAEENPDQYINSEEGQISLKAYPNPLTTIANIEFSVPESGQAKVEVYNMLGMKVATLFDEEVEEGYAYTSVFYANELAKGVYLIRLTTGTESLVERIILAD